jgi:hypothetical protein
MHDITLIYLQIGLSTSDAIDALKKAKLVSIANQIRNNTSICLRNELLYHGTKAIDLEYIYKINWNYVFLTMFMLNHDFTYIYLVQIYFLIHYHYDVHYVKATVKLYTGKQDLHN